MKPTKRNKKKGKSFSSFAASSLKDVDSGSDNEPIGDMYTDEISDFTADRNKVSMGPENSDSEDEEPILPLNQDDDDESDEELGEWSRRLTQIKYDSKVEKMNNKKLQSKEMKAGGSWGDHRSAYYGAFSKFSDRKVDATEEDDWTLEAREVDMLQAKLDEEVDEEDFMIPSLAVSLKTKKKKVKELTVKQDLTEKERKEHLEKLHPEAQPLREELNRCLEELESLKGKKGWRIESKDTCFRLLAANIAFYLHLIESGTDCRGHPVLTRIVQWKRLAKMYQEIPDHLMEESDEESDTEVKRPMRTNSRAAEGEDGAGDNGGDEGARGDNWEMEEDGPSRPITLQMEKNRVTTKKPKKNNPRVKHKEKFKKATVKRRVYVPEHKSEMKKYQGEERGIRAFVKKSVRLH